VGERPDPLLWVRQDGVLSMMLHCDIISKSRVSRLGNNLRLLRQVLTNQCRKRSNFATQTQSEE